MRYLELVVLSAIATLVECVVQMSHEKRLIRDLIGNYTLRGKMGRPVQEQNDTITIYYGMSLIQILDLDERNQVLSTNVWATYHWKDMYLAWNESEYGNISTVRVKNEDIWKPDIKLYNYADERLEEKRDALCVLSSDGSVVWIPQAVFKSSCSIDIRHFPFDEQTCELKFGSWTYDGSKLDLQFRYKEVAGFEMTDYIKSNEWDIVESNARRNVLYYECCPEPYVDLIFKLVMRRKVAFYNYILILPCVLLSSLTLVLFWLPPESPAKMQLGMNIFVAFFVLLLLLAESTPPAASSIPLIGAYYCLNMILITLSTLLSVVIVNLYFHGPGTRVPRFFKRLMLDFFARVFCMRNTLMDKKERQERRNSLMMSRAPPSGEGGNGGGGNGGRPGGGTTTTASYTKNNKDKRHVEFKYDRVGVFELQPEENWRPMSNGLGSDTDLSERIVTLPSQYNQLESEVREIRRHLRHLVDKNAEKANKEYLAREWKLVALVLDRLFFFLYLLALLVSAFTLFETTVFQSGRNKEGEDSS
ncbi:neuronal acetylcholine receptor subunit alpha-10 isoform X2 [Aplysia californica]|uniref:Neuronal acetylcholine receptor subunit alpha-10 isoform X2 n=1 Tax=Aplysia californica TaxID=6500 RepID=A0ABM1A6Y2_APLCA|nr:neuronal acetylcholine receptor subunit alpha-10 isoform X2 [Aplysia californica]